MIQHFLQFVTAVLLVAIFWELCKINGQLKRSIPQISERGQADDADKSRGIAGPLIRWYSQRHYGSFEQIVVDSGDLIKAHPFALVCVFLVG
jgi:hypothetical protein